MTRYRHLITEDNAKWWTLAAMCFALFMIMLDNTVVNVALPSIQSDLDASISSLEWTINGYTLSFAVLLATGGRLGDILGRRRIFLAGVVLFAASSATAGLAPTDTALVASRVIQGIGAALMMPATLSIITNAFPADERGKAIGTWAGSLRPGARDRPAARRLPHRARLLAGDLLPQPAGRGRGDRRRRCSRSASRGTRPSAARSTGLGTGDPDRRTHRAGPRARRGQRLGLGLGADHRPARRLGRIRSRAFLFVEGRVRAPIIQFEFLRSRDFVGALLVAFVISFSMLGHVLLHGPLHPEHPRLLAARGRRPVPADDAGDHRHRADRRPAHRPDRAAPADRQPASAIVAVSLFMQSRIDVGSGYGDLLVPFILMGVGIALTMSPMSTAAMNAVADDEGRARLGPALDVADGRRHLRGRRARRDLPGPAAAPTSTTALAPIGRRRGPGSTRSPSSSAAAGSTRRSRPCPPDQAQPGRGRRPRGRSSTASPARSRSRRSSPRAARSSRWS